MTVSTHDQKIKQLAANADAREKALADRDRLILEAHDAELSIKLIAAASRLSRMQVHRIINNAASAEGVEK